MFCVKPDIRRLCFASVFGTALQLPSPPLGGTWGEGCRRPAPRVEVSKTAVFWTWCASLVQAVCFDVDSTVLRDEGIDVLAGFCGVAQAVTDLTHRRVVRLCSIGCCVSPSRPFCWLPPG